MSPEEVKHNVDYMNFAMSQAPEGAVMGFAYVPKQVDDNFGKVMVCTCGLTLHGMPELIITGQTEHFLAQVIGTIASAVANKELTIEDGQILDQFTTARMQAHKLTAQQARLPGAVCYAIFREHGKWPEFIQLAIADRHDKLPGEEGYEAEYMHNYGQREYWNK